MAKKGKIVDGNTDSVFRLKHQYYNLRLTTAFFCNKIEKEVNGNYACHLRSCSLFY
jgi:hypothetical protein